MERSYSPGSREIMAYIVDLWKKDPSTEKLGYVKLLAKVKEDNATWALSEKRLKTVLKEFNLQPNRELFTYIKETTTQMDPETVLNMIPKSVRLQMTKGRGKGLFAVRDIKNRLDIWSEIAVVQTPPPELLAIMRSGNACAFCGSSLRTADGQLVTRSAGVSCTVCPANWCNVNCKHLNRIHADLCHNSMRNKLNVLAWKEYEMFCTENNWRAGLLLGIALVTKFRSDARFNIAGFLSSLATVGQDVRQRAVSEPNTLEYEELERMWKSGHRILSRTFAGHLNLSYEDYLKGIGMVNINNLDGAIFLTHSHLNHSCAPNVKVEKISRSEGIKVIACEDIASGQELTTSYVDPNLPYEERQYKLRVNWGFICSCKRCRSDKVAAAKKDEPSAAEPSAGRKRSKSVRFESNPVSSCKEIPPV